jgi:transposase
MLVVRLRVGKGYSLGQISQMYNLSEENVVKWTRRFLNGEQLTMKRGRSGKKKCSSEKPQETTQSLEAQLEQLRTELAYKDKLIEFLEERERVKKKRNSGSSKN